MQRPGGRKARHTFKASKDGIMVPTNPDCTYIQGEVHTNERAQRAHVRGTERSHIFRGTYLHRQAQARTRHKHAEQYAAAHRAVESGWPARNTQMNRRMPERPLAGRRACTHRYLPVCPYVPRCEMSVYHSCTGLRTLTLHTWHAHTHVHMMREGNSTCVLLSSRKRGDL